jgi:hypothetical protein
MISIFCRGSRVGCDTTDSQAARLPPQITHDRPDYCAFGDYFCHRSEPDWHFLEKPIQLRNPHYLYCVFGSGDARIF